MFSKVKTPLLGVVENMSFMQISGKLQSSNTDLSDVELYIHEKKISLEDDKSFNYKFFHSVNNSTAIIGHSLCLFILFDLHGGKYFR